MRKPKPKESSIQTAILKYLNSLPGCRARNNHGSAFSGAGTPDITACYYGQHIEIEVKRPGGQLTKLQAHELAKWAEAGAITIVATGVEDVKLALVAFDPGRRWFEERQRVFGLHKLNQKSNREGLNDGNQRA